MRHLLVTGGGRGIGAAIVRRAVAAGDRVSFTYRSDDEAARALRSDLGDYVLPIRSDVSHDGDAGRVLSEAVEWSGPLHGLVNNAGITGRTSTFVDLPIDQVREVFDVNVVGLLAITQAVVRRWRRDATTGVVVNVSSIAARLGGANEFIGYASSKAAVDAITLGLGRELAPHGIRVVGIGAGTTRTDIHAEAGDPERPVRAAAGIPLGRIAEPDEIAATVLFALSPEASFITAATIPVAGGL